jgi:hypothetical protein
VHYQFDIGAVTLEEGPDAGVVSNIYFFRAKALKVSLKRCRNVCGRRFRTEEVGPHVVFDPDHVEPRLDEEADGLRADQAARASDDRRWNGP